MATIDNRDKATGQIARDSARKEAPRERTANFGGPRLKLSVPKQIPGFHLFFQNDDDDGVIEQLLDEGFSFVTKSEVGMGRGTNSQAIVADDDVTDRVSRFVGKKADGSAMRAYLLKCPQELWDERMLSSGAQADAWEESIKAEQRDPSPGRYLPNGVTPALNPNYRKEY